MEIFLEMLSLHLSCLKKISLSHSVMPVGTTCVRSSVFMSCEISFILLMNAHCIYYGWSLFAIVIWIITRGNTITETCHSLLGLLACCLMDIAFLDHPHPTFWWSIAHVSVIFPLKATFFLLFIFISPFFPLLPIFSLYIFSEAFTFRRIPQVICIYIHIRKDSMPASPKSVYIQYPLQWPCCLCLILSLDSFLWI